MSPELLSSPNGLFAIHLKYGEVFNRIGGSEYKVLSRLSHSTSATVQRRKAMWERYQSHSIEWWLGREVKADL